MAAGKDRMKRCKTNGRWEKPKNPFYAGVADYFRAAAKERGCDRP